MVLVGLSNLSLFACSPQIFCKIENYQTPGKLHVEMFLGPPDSLLEQPETVPNNGKKLLANFCNRYFFHFVLILLDTRPTNPLMMHFY